MKRPARATRPAGLFIPALMAHAHAVTGGTCSLRLDVGKFENLKPGNAIFVQYPAQTNHIRLLRGVKEYSQFVLFPLFFINILLGYYLLENNKINYIYIQMILSLIFYNYIDKTCI